mgnify:CR=1 FL=1
MIDPTRNPLGLQDAGLAGPGNMTPVIGIKRRIGRARAGGGE